VGRVYYAASSLVVSGIAGEAWPALGRRLARTVCGRSSWMKVALPGFGGHRDTVQHRARGTPLRARQTAPCLICRIAQPAAQSRVTLHLRVTSVRAPMFATSNLAQSF